MNCLTVRGGGKLHSARILRGLGRISPSFIRNPRHSTLDFRNEHLVTLNENPACDRISNTVLNLSKDCSFFLVQAEAKCPGAPHL